MELYELLRILAHTLETNQIEYFVAGSMATIAYGEPRFTNDIDVVVALRYKDIEVLCTAFPAAEYYISRNAVRDAIRLQHQFNIIHPSSGLKVDVIIPPDAAFEAIQRKRTRRLPTPGGFDATFCSPEDVIIKKLDYYREGGSEKHLRDIAGVLKIQGERIDRAYIDEWTSRLKLTEVWRMVQDRVDGPKPAIDE